MAVLAQRYGWSFTGQSEDYANVTKLPAWRQHEDICGSARAIADHGLPGAAGLFAYPDNRWNIRVQTRVTETCFAFGRMYQWSRPGLQVGVNAVPVPAAENDMVSTFSLNGGYCADTAAACHNLSDRFRYTNPAVLARVLTVDPGHWNLVQGYGFATVAGSYGTLSWSCTSSDWRDHWTAGVDATELYCWKDWLAALASIRPGTQDVSPAQLAALYPPTRAAP